MDPNSCHCNWAVIYSWLTLLSIPEILAAVLSGGVSPITKQRILGSDMVELMVENQIPHMPDFARKGLENAIPFLTNTVQELYPQPGNPPQGWSIGGMLTLEADSRTGRNKGTVHWCGAANLFWWLDIESGVAGILATQIFPFFGMCKLILITMLINNLCYPDNRVLELREKLEKTIYDHVAL